jgi:hypothetical protein
MKYKIFPRKSLRRNSRAVSPAISTVIITSAVIVLILVAMMYSNNFLNASIAENEFEANKQFMKTTALQIDDIAWIVGRAQTIHYSSKYGSVNFQSDVLNYTFEVRTKSGQDFMEEFTTGAIMFSMITNSPLLDNTHFQNVSASRAINQTGSSAPVANVFATEKGTTSGDNLARIVVVPTIRMLNSPIGNQSYVKFFLPLLQKGTIGASGQSVTLIGQPGQKYVYDDVDYVKLTATYPAETRGYDSAFFNFEQSSVTIPLGDFFPDGCVVDFYLGEVTVSLGLYA